MSFPASPPGLRLLAALVAALTPGAAGAHVSERALVLLLPTEVYLPAGAAAVAVSAATLAVIPAGWARRAAGGLRLGPRLGGAAGARRVVGLAASALFFGLVALGWFGPRDPLGNLAPLMLWTGLYIALPALQLVFGDLWRWINPWSALCARLSRGRPPPLRLPEGVGVWPAVAGWAAISGFALADPAPDDPARLAVVALGYWAAMAAGALLFGEAWLRRGEAFTLWLSLFARLAPLRLEGGRPMLRLPSARLAREAAPGVSGAVFVIVVLGLGSFDGLNETFWWFARLGLNPLEPPGRSALIAETLLGMAGGAALLAAVFAACAAGGAALAGAPERAGVAVRRLAPSLIPIAAGYHIAHYLTVFLVQGQYLAAAVADPFATGAGWFGPVHVTTSFFNAPASVHAIWLAQAGAIVLGHVAGVFAAHLIALDLFGGARRAAASQAPLAAFMALYTLFGLWLLASPTAG